MECFSPKDAQASNLVIQVFFSCSLIWLKFSLILGLCSPSSQIGKSKLCYKELKLLYYYLFITTLVGDSLKTNIVL